MLSENSGKLLWNCKKCSWIHKYSTCRLIFERLKGTDRKIEEISSEHLLRIFHEVVEKASLKTVKTLMIQGTSSHSGKSILVTALCKILRDLGYKVAPFKAQNMSLNSFVTRDGDEISRSQTLQAFAAGIEPTSDMNPILIKPKGNTVSQIVLRGKSYADMKVSDYYSSFVKNEGTKAVEKSLKNLISQYDVIVIEGAGSPVEINLEDEIANMFMAELADAPVLIVADIDRGGVFAQIAGTIQLLKPEHRMRVKGFIINKFRGDLEILKPGLKQIEEYTEIQILGVLPHVENLSLPDEDSLSLEEYSKSPTGILKIAVIRLPKISNFTDFDPLISEKLMKVYYVKERGELKDPDVIIIPGTKNTVHALEWLRESGLADEIIRLSNEGVPVIGICGGFQILGRKIIDQKGIESDIKTEFEGLNLLDVTTEFEHYSKVTKQVKANIISRNPIMNSVYGETIRGYEIHMGRSILGQKCKPVFKIMGDSSNTVERLEGAVDDSGLVFGTYMHGIFDSPPIRRGLMVFLLQKKGITEEVTSRPDIVKTWEEGLENLVETVKENIDLKAILEILETS